MKCDTGIHAPKRMKLTETRAHVTRVTANCSLLASVSSVIYAATVHNGGPLSWIMRQDGLETVLYNVPPSESPDFPSSSSFHISGETSLNLLNGVAQNKWSLED